MVGLGVKQAEVEPDKRLRFLLWVKLATLEDSYHETMARWD